MSKNTKNPETETATAVTEKPVKAPKTSKKVKAPKAPKKVKTVEKIADGIEKTSARCYYITTLNGERKYCSVERFEKLLARAEGDLAKLVADYRVRNPKSEEDKIKVASEAVIEEIEEVEQEIADELKIAPEYRAFEEPVEEIEG